MDTDDMIPVTEPLDLLEADRLQWNLYDQAAEIAKARRAGERKVGEPTPPPSRP